MIFYNKEINSKKFFITESQLRLLIEGNDNEKRARNYIRQSGICYNSDKEKEEETINRFFNYIRNVFSSSDSKSYAYRHIQGIVKMILGNVTPENPGVLVFKNNVLVRRKDGFPKLDEKRLFNLLQRVNIAAEEEMSSNVKKYDNSFRKVGTNVDNNFDDFVDANSLPTKEEYLKNLLEKYEIFTTPKGYTVVKIPNFSVANMFSPYVPFICYLHKIKSYNEYAGDNRIFLAFKNTYNGIKEIPLKNGEFRTVGRMNDYAVSCIGIAVHQVGLSELVTTTSRYDWHKGGTNYDYDFDELSELLGINVKTWLSNEFETNNLYLNLPNTKKKLEKKI